MMSLKTLESRYLILEKINDKIMNSDFAVITEFAAWTLASLMVILFGGGAIYGTAGTGLAMSNLIEVAPIIGTALLPAVVVRGIRGGFKIAERRAYNRYIQEYNTTELINAVNKGIDKIIALACEKSANMAEISKAVDNLLRMLAKKEKKLNAKQERKIEKVLMQHVQIATKDLSHDKKRMLGQIFQMQSNGK